MPARSKEVMAMRSRRLHLDIEMRQHSAIEGAVNNTGEKTRTCDRGGGASGAVDGGGGHEVQAVAAQCRDMASAVKKESAHL